MLLADAGVLPSVDAGSLAAETGSGPADGTVTDG